jgi:hypothetical protein
MKDLENNCNKNECINNVFVEESFQWLVIWCCCDPRAFISLNIFSIVFWLYFRITTIFAISVLDSLILKQKYIFVFPICIFIMQCFVLSIDI